MSDAAAPPLFCVIVPTFDSQTTLEATLRSLAQQTWRDFEVIVSDGASRDDTLAIARRHAELVPALTIDSRPDQGTYDAINRAIDRARGEWILILGSDDRLHAPGTLQQVAPAARSSSASVMYGDVCVAGPEPLAGVAVGGRYAGALALVDLCRRNLCQQSVFYRRTLFDQIGRFNLRYRRCADWDFNLRAAFRSPIEWIDVVVADYATSGISSLGIDDEFRSDWPRWLQAELAARPFDRALWPVQHRLVSGANALRKMGRRVEALQALGLYGKLLAQRGVALMRR